MKALHRRRAPYRPRLEFAIGLLGLAVCGLGIGLVTADVLEEREVRISTQHSPTTTTTMVINSSVIEPETTTTVAPTTTTAPRPVGRVPAPALKKIAVSVPAPSSTTTTTEVPKTPLEIAQSQVGKTGLYADGGFWCARLQSWIAEQAGLTEFRQDDSPARLHTYAVSDGRITDTPQPGYLVFIDLTGKHYENEYISHVGIVESVEDDVIHTIEGNTDNSGLVTRQTRKIGDGYVIDFAPFTS
jgi:CHAP domain